MTVQPKHANASARRGHTCPAEGLAEILPGLSWGKLGRRHVAFLRGAGPSPPRGAEDASHQLLAASLWANLVNSNPAPPLFTVHGETEPAWRPDAGVRPVRVSHPRRVPPPPRPGCLSHSSFPSVHQRRLSLHLSAPPGRQRSHQEGG